MNAKTALAALLMLNYSLALAGDEEPSAVTENQTPVFDAEKAERLGADRYGMKKYVMAFLKKGPNRDQDPEEAASLQKAHLKNIGRMADRGLLVLAGPFFDDGEIRGIYIFNVETVAEAEALTETDPAIKAGRLVMELRPWYGTAGLMEVNKIHKTLQEKSVADD